jgi:iron(III) transport system substrate-binding protein
MSRQPLRKISLKPWACMLLGALALMGAFAPSAAAQSPADWEKLIAAAKKEGKVTVYNGTGYRIIGDLGEQFTKQYGIQVEVLVGRASEIRERLRSEQAAGRAIADLLYSGATSMNLQMKEGAFVAHGPVVNAQDVAPPLEDNGTLLPINVGNFAMLVNTNMLKESEAPKSWKELADPKWDGKLLSDDPRALGAGEVWFEVTLRAFGRDFHEKVAARKPVFSRIYAESQRRIARGEYPIYLPFNVSETQGLKGLPVRVVIPTEGVPYIVLTTALVKDAPHPNAAKLFMSYLLSRDSQLFFVKEGFRPVTKDALANIPAELAPLTLAKLLGTTIPEKVEEHLALAKEIYK